jgi:flagellar motor component MotA
MVLRIIAMGFITREFSYMRNFWNLNDFIVVIFGWIAVVIRNKTLEAIKIIRILRLIRAANLLPNMTSLL